MDEFVQTILQQWGLACFIEKFKNAGIDNEIFGDIDNDMMNKLFQDHECGFKKKFFNKFEAWKKDERPSIGISTIQAFESTSSLSVHPVDESESQIIPFCAPSEPQSQTSNISIIRIEPVQRKSVLDLIQTTLRGKIVHEDFAINKKLDTRILSDLIIENEFEFSGHYRIKQDRFLVLRQEIAEIFTLPEKSVLEIAELFFFTYSKTTDNKTRTYPGGILYEKYLKLRSKLIKVKLLKKKDYVPEDIISLENDSLIWLAENDSPEELAVEKWKESFAHREKCNDIATYFASYKCLRTTFGHILLSIDFDTIHADCAKFETSWKNVASNIINEAKKKKKTFDESLVESEDLAALLCLPGLLGVILRKRKNVSGQNFGTTVEDVKKSFILCVQKYEDFLAFKSHRNTICEGNKISPYVVAIGDLHRNGELEVPEEMTKLNVYLVIGEFSFVIRSNNIFDAVEYCFKCSVVLNNDFPQECRHVWTFVQMCCFENVSIGKPYAVATKLFQSLKQT